MSTIKFKLFKRSLNSLLSLLLKVEQYLLYVHLGHQDSAVCELFCLFLAKGPLKLPSWTCHMRCNCWEIGVYTFEVIVSPACLQRKHLSHAVSIIIIYSILKLNISPTPNSLTYSRRAARPHDSCIFFPERRVD